MQGNSKTSESADSQQAPDWSESGVMDRRKRVCPSYPDSVNRSTFFLIAKHGIRVVLKVMNN